MVKSFMVQVFSLVFLFMSLTSVSAHANQDDITKQQIRADKDYNTNVAKARNMLQARGGYQVKDIQADVHDSQRCLQVEAYKGAVRYEIKLTYPDLKIIKEKAER